MLLRFLQHHTHNKCITLKIIGCACIAAGAEQMRRLAAFIKQQIRSFQIPLHGSMSIFPCYPAGIYLGIFRNFKMDAIVTFCIKATAPFSGNSGGAVFTVILDQYAEFLSAFIVPKEGILYAHFLPCLFKQGIVGKAGKFPIGRVRNDNAKL